MSRLKEVKGYFYNYWENDYPQGAYITNPIKPLTIAISFDGIIVEDNYPDIGRMIEDADIMIRKLKLQGHTIIIYSDREHNKEKQAIDFLKAMNIPFDHFNNLKIKSKADVYIDNKSLFYNEQPWSTIFYKLTDKAKRKVEYPI